MDYLKQYYLKIRQVAAQYLKKILAFLKLRTPVAGLEISDSLLRIAYFDEKIWRMNAVRLEPGVMESGKIKDRAKFVATLKELKLKVFNAKEAKEKIYVVASLSSINIYSQVFSLPLIEGENLEKAIQLNVQMVSPVETSQAYSGWQLVGRDQDALRLEILSAFIERATVDEITKDLFDAGFIVVAMESRALALSRVFREQGEGIDVARSYVMVSIDSSGIDFLIVRRGQLYFEYFNPWKDLMDEKGEVLLESFRAAILRSLHQVLNFYGQHWPDEIASVVVSAVAMKEEALKVISENFSVPAKELRLRTDGAFSPDWHIALGCALRGRKRHSGDQELSLLGIDSREEFQRERLLSFLRLWRLAMPLSMGLFVLLFFLADLFLAQSDKSIGSESLFNVSGEQFKESQTLQAEAKDFNSQVAMIRAAEDQIFSKGKILRKLQGLLSANSITMNDLNFSSPGQPITLRGATNSEDKLLAFKNALEKDPAFKNVDLPITGINSQGGQVNFSMSFSLSL